MPANPVGHWRESCLGDCATRRVERVDPKEHAALPYLGLEHLGQGTLSLVGVGQAAEVVSTSLLVDPDDILFGSLRPYFRKLVRAPWPALCTAEAWVLRAKPGTDQGFLFYLLADPAFIEHCTRSSQGTRMPRANWQFASSYRVCLPPLAEQRRIAALLETLDAKIALNRRMNSTLEQTARTLFKAWFVDFDGLETRDRVASAMGPIPRGWRVGALDQVACQLRDGADPATLQADTAYVGLEHVPRRSAALESWGQAAEVNSAKHRFLVGDVLFGKLRPYFHKVVPAPCDGVASTDILVVRPLAEVWRWFVFGHLSSEAMVAHASAAADGTRMPRTRWADLCRFPMALPPGPVVGEYARLVDPLFGRIQANIHASRALAALRDLLLPRLISGAVRVPVTVLKAE